MAKRLKKSIKSFFSNFLGFLIMILITVLMIEGFLRISYPTYANFNTEMWRYSTEIKKLSDVEGVSHEHMPNKESNLYFVDLQTNSMGFRDKEYSKEKLDGTKRYLVIGDSVTLGWGVNESDAYSEVLETMLNSQEPSNTTNISYNYEVINTAVGNFNTEMEVKILEKYLDLDFDAVVVGFFPNDAEKTIIVDKDLSYMLKKSFYIYPFFWDRFVKIKYLFSAGTGELTSKIHEYYTDEYGGKERVLKALRDLRILSEENNFDVYIVAIPQLFKPFTEYDSQYIHEFIAKEANDNGFVFIDTLDSFKKHNLSEIIISREDAHPNALGHRLIAEDIYEVLANE
jgi:lysophospholipase L1-like esterase